MYINIFLYIYINISIHGYIFLQVIAYYMNRVLWRSLLVPTHFVPTNIPTFCQPLTLNFQKFEIIFL